MACEEKTAWTSPPAGRARIDRLPPGTRRDGWERAPDRLAVRESGWERAPDRLAVRESGWESAPDRLDVMESVAGSTPKVSSGSTSGHRVSATAAIRVPMATV